MFFPFDLNNNKQIGRKQIKRISHWQEDISSWSDDSCPWPPGTSKISFLSFHELDGNWFTFILNSSSVCCLRVFCLLLELWYWKVMVKCYNSIMFKIKVKCLKTVTSTEAGIISEGEATQEVTEFNHFSALASLPSNLEQNHLHHLHHLHSQVY